MKVIGNMHFIRKHILRVLAMNKWARFRDMRHPRVDSNLYNYHLKQLIKEGYVEQVAGKGYRLSPMGLRYVDHVSLEVFEPRWQPKIITKILAKNKKGQILMWPKYKQPFIGSWSLPSGKMHYEDLSIEASARREISYFTEQTVDKLGHRGVVEIVAHINQQMITHSIEHVFSMEIDEHQMIHPKSEWKDVDEISLLRTSPGTRELICLLESHENFFYKKIEVEW